MHTLKNAHDLLMKNVHHICNIEQIYLKDATNRILANDIIASIDMPSFNYATVDGYACHIKDILMLKTLKIKPIIVAAGDTNNALFSIALGECIKIMTGAMLPLEADCVIKKEDIKIINIEYICIDEKKIKYYNNGYNKSINSYNNLNIRFLGEDFRKGDVVLNKGTLIKAQHMAILASIGCVAINVVCKPIVGILATGSELVKPSEKLTKNRVYDSNTYNILSDVIKSHSISKIYGIVQDDINAICAIIDKAKYETNILIISGGVSVGDYDYIPYCMQKLGLKIIFKKIAFRPGQHTLVSIRDNFICFGLSGNPVASFLQFELLIRPYLYQMCGSTYRPYGFYSILGVDLPINKTYHECAIPVIIKEDGLVYNIDYHGSSHIYSYNNINYIIICPAKIIQLKKGMKVYVRQI